MRVKAVPARHDCVMLNPKRAGMSHEEYISSAITRINRRFRLFAVFTAVLMAVPSVSLSAAGVFLPLPDNMETSFKTYMDYRTITDKASDQYRLQQQAYTDSDGIRRVEDDVCIAVGSAYADEIGTRLRINLDSGKSFTAVVGDLKADCDTDETNRFYPVYDGMADITEFIVDTDMIDPKVKKSGSVGSYDRYSGNITSIELLDSG